MGGQDVVERFLSRFGSGTVAPYSSALKHLERFSGMSLEELVDLGRRDRDRLVGIIEDFKVYLKRSGVSTDSIGTYLAGIRSFFKQFGIEIRVRRERSSPKMFDYIPKPEEAGMIIKHVDTVDKIIEEITM